MLLLASLLVSSCTINVVLGKEKGFFLYGYFVCTVQDGQPKNVHLALKSDLGKFLPQFQLKAVMHCTMAQVLKEMGNTKNQCFRAHFFSLIVSDRNI